MKSSRKYLESALWFYVGLVFVGILRYTVDLLRFVFRDGPGPEGANLLLLLALFAAMAIPYYGVFVATQHALAKVCKPVLDRNYFLPVSLSAGAVVCFVFAGELDFLFWMFYHQTPAMGTIFPSALIVEVLFLLLNFAIVSRMEMTDSRSRRASRLALILIFASLLLLVMSWPLLYGY
jgi:hypothetical protein